jgi:hypothetical protein
MPKAVKVYRNFSELADAFALTGNGSEYVRVNSGGTALEPVTAATVRAAVGGAQTGLADGTAVLAATPQFVGQWVTAVDGFIGVAFGTGSGDVQSFAVVTDGLLYFPSAAQFQSTFTVQGAGQIKLESSHDSTIQIIAANSSNDAVSVVNNAAGGFSATRYCYDGDGEGKLAIGVANSGTGSGWEGAKTGSALTYIQIFEEFDALPAPGFVIRQYGVYSAQAARDYDRLVINSDGSFKILGLTAGSLAGPEAVVVSIAGNVTLGGGGGHVIVGGSTAASELRFLEPSGSGTHYTAFKAQAQAGNVTYTFPAADSAGVLTSNGSGTLTWGAAGGGDVTQAGNNAFTGVNTFTMTTGEAITVSYGGDDNNPAIILNQTDPSFNTAISIRQDGVEVVSIGTGGSVDAQGLSAEATFAADNGIVQLVNGGTATVLRFLEPSGSGSNYSDFKAVAQAANITYELPASIGTSGQVLGGSVSGTTKTLEWVSVGGTKTIRVFTPENNQPPAANYATFNTRNSIAVLEFDPDTDEAAIFVGVIPEAAILTSGLSIIIKWMGASATSGDVIWGAQLERCNTDLDTDSFDTAQTATGAANGTTGIITSTTITLTNIDSVAAGELYRLKIYRDANNGSDNMAGDAQLIAVEVRTAN